MKLNILIAGVGGQGTLLASRVLGSYASIMGYDCKLSEVHGMAQRGGSVVTYVKFDKKVYSPIIADGDADVLLAFEQLEAYRWAHNVKSGGNLIVNAQKIMPLPVIVGDMQYPQDILTRLDNPNYKLTVVDAHKIAHECGNIKVINTIMLGVLAAAVNLDKNVLRQAIIASIPEKVKDVNLLALEKSYSIM